MSKNINYLRPFEFVSFPQQYSSLWVDDDEFIQFQPSHHYAVKEQLQKFIQEINSSIDATYFGNSQCGIQNLPRNEMLKRFVPEGHCPFINQTVTTIKNYFEKNNLSFDKFIELYPNHNILFNNNVSNYEKIHYISNNYDEIEKNINRIRRKIMK